MSEKNLKDKIRDKYRRLRRETHSEINKEIDLKITNNLFLSDFWQNAKNVFLYININDEVSTEKIIHGAFDEGKSVLAPRTNSNGDMDAVEIKSLRELSSTEFGVPEPYAILPVFPIAEIDLVIVPSLCIDETGGRIGYGGGYYDRFLAKLKKNPHGKRATSIAIQREYAVIKEPLPLTFRDEAPDIIITDKRTIIIDTLN